VIKLYKMAIKPHKR